ncbi:MAG: hypothetical protein AB1630_12265 [bacterium]
MKTRLSKGIAGLITLALLEMGWAQDEPKGTEALKPKEALGTGTKEVHPVYPEEYVPRVIIEGRWGTEIGEFGLTAWEGEPEWPTSFVLNSKGEICILDHINNRIQIFSNSGKYLNSIPVESYERASEAKPEQFEESMKTWNTLGYDFATIRAEDLFLDKEDNFYLDQDRINVKPGGETIRETRRIKHTRAGKKVALSQEKLGKVALLQDQSGGSLIELEKEKYQVSLGTKTGNIQVIEILNPRNKSIKEIQFKLKYPITEIGFIKTDKKGDIYIFTGWPPQIYKYDRKRILLCVINLIGLPNPYGKHPLISSLPRIDKEGNIYQMELIPNPDKEIEYFPLYADGIQIIKWEIKKR